MAEPADAAVLSAIARMTDNQPLRFGILTLLALMTASGVFVAVWKIEPAYAVGGARR